MTYLFFGSLAVASCLFMPAPALQQEELPTFEGVIVSLDQHAIVVEYGEDENDSKSQIFQLTPETKYFDEDKPIGLADLGLFDYVVVEYEKKGEDLVARKVTVLPVDEEGNAVPPKPYRLR